MKIKDFIPKGRKNAISNAALASALNMSERDTRTVVMNARLNGELICSGNSGYYIPLNADEAEEYYRQQYKRMKSGAAMLRPVKDYIDKQRRSWTQLGVSDIKEGADFDDLFE